MEIEKILNTIDLAKSTLKGDEQANIDVVHYIMGVEDALHYALGHELTPDLNERVNAMLSDLSM